MCSALNYLDENECKIINIVFSEWSIESNGQKVKFESINKEDLNENLRRFYAEATPKNVKNRAEQMGESLAGEYHKNSLVNVRAALNRHLKDLKRNEFDIVRDREFKPANQMLDGKLKHNVKSGVSRPTKHKEIISQEDLEKINTYLAPSTPVLLRYRIWFNLAIHFVSRGLEFHQQLNTKSFTFSHDENGREFVSIEHELKQKNWQGGLANKETSGDKRMYETGDDNCPVKLLKLFLSKTDPNAEALFNQCKKEAMESPSREEIWFTSKAVKPYQFTKFMRDISKNAKCTRVYTAHCLRATSIQAMNDSGHELRHIMLFTGHRNESSIRSYSRDATSKQKANISSTLSSLSGSTQNNQLQLPGPTSMPVRRTNPQPTPATFALGAPGQLSNNVSQDTCVVDPLSMPPTSHYMASHSQNILSAGLLSHSSFQNCTFSFGK